MKPPRIKTTVVGSYPLPDWLAAAPSEQALEDAMRVVLHTQEQAGIDLVCDGELYRFDLNHPETNGMIEYFMRPMRGIRSEIGFSEWLAYSKGAGMRFRARPPGVVEGPVGAGTLNLSLACARAKRARHAGRSSSRSPARTCWRRRCIDLHYRDPEKLAHAIADVLAAQVKHLDADVIQVDEANLPGHPGRMGVGRGGDQQGAEGGAEEGEGGGAPVLRQLRRAEHPEGQLGQADRLPERAARRPHRAWKSRTGRPRSWRCSRSCGARSASASAWWTSSAPRSRRADAIARAIERAEKILGRGPREVHPSGLRLLDAEAEHRGRQDPRPGEGTGPV